MNPLGWFLITAAAATALYALGRTLNDSLTSSMNAALERWDARLDDPVDAELQQLLEDTAG